MTFAGPPMRNGSLIVSRNSGGGGMYWTDTSGDDSRKDNGGVPVILVEDGSMNLCIYMDN